MSWGIHEAQLIAELRAELFPLESSHEAPWIVAEGLRLYGEDYERVRSFSQLVLERRRRHEPLAYIFGAWSFRNFEFFVGPGVLIPRPETEELVDFALAEALHDIEQADLTEYSFADFGAGTGCIGLSLAIELACELAKKKKNTKVRAFLVERSPEAFAYLQKNYQSLHSQLAEVEVELFQGSWEDFSSSVKLNLICSNPPYVSRNEWLEVEASVKDFEPSEALHARDVVLDPDCRAVYETLISKALTLMHFGATILMEHGAAQVPWLSQKLHEDTRFHGVRQLQDMSAKDRFVIAKFN